MRFSITPRIEYPYFCLGLTELLFVQKSSSFLNSIRLHFYVLLRFLLFIIILTKYDVSNQQYFMKIETTRQTTEKTTTNKTNIVAELECMLVVSCLT